MMHIYISDYDSRILSTGGSANCTLNYYARTHAFSGSVSINSATVATQSWTHSQNSLTTSPASITVSGTGNLNAIFINNGTGNSFIVHQNASGTYDNLVHFNKLYGHPMYIGQSGDGHIPTSFNGDGMVYLA